MEMAFSQDMSAGLGEFTVWAGKVYIWFEFCIEIAYVSMSCVAL